MRRRLQRRLGICLSGKRFHATMRAIDGAELKPDTSTGRQTATAKAPHAAPRAAKIPKATPPVQEFRQKVPSKSASVKKTTARADGDDALDTVTAPEAADTAVPAEATEALAPPAEAASPASLEPMAAAPDEIATAETEPTPPPRVEADVQTVAPTPSAADPAEPATATAAAANDSVPQAVRPALPPHLAPRPPGGVPGRVMPPPRPMAKAEQFAEGDHVVYPTHGVGKVERIAVEEIAGHKLELIHITFEENRMTLRVPVAKARSAGLRKLASRKVFDDALAVLKGRARIKRTMWSRRAQEYEAKINSGDPLAIAEVVRDLHRNAGQPDQSFSERQIYEAAMDRLAAELGALERIDKVAASIKLAEFLKTV
jgi:CarD family transcriptional regulator